MITFVTYGHTDYIDILKIHGDFQPCWWNCRNILFIDKSDKLTPNITKWYDKIIFYDDTKPYATRIVECLNQIDDEYFLLILDTDIVLKMINDDMEDLFELMKENNWDRIDLKQTFNFNSSTIIPIYEDLCLVKSEDANDYIYNLNPSIWKRTALLEVMSTFPQKNYREIEGRDVQEFCRKFNVFKLHSDKWLECGWFQCLDLFKFLHISHGGKLLPLNETFTTPSGQSYVDCYREYLEIYSRYDLKNIKLKHFLG